MGKRDRVKVASIDVELPDGHVSKMTIVQAQELHRQLNELFGTSAPMFPAPIIIERERWPWWRREWTHDNTGSITSDQPPPLPKVWCHAG